MRNTILFLFIGIFITAQTNPFVINGLVVNEQKQPVLHSVVKLKDKSYEYTTSTDNKGTFSKKLYNAEGKISIRIEHSEYDILETEIEPYKKEYQFVLAPKSKLIEEVVLEKGIIQKGDSTIYNANYFSNKKENKVIDLLKKLPNVDVDRKGNISVNGKEVSKVLVENETFFTGGTAMAINSLPADAVSRFEFVDGHQENAVLEGYSDKTILNIALKEEKKQLVFGDLFLNGNSMDRYKVGANLFYYAPKTKVNLISNLNNVNESPISIEDYFAFSGGMDRLFRNISGFINNVNVKEFQEILMPNEKYHNSQIFNGVNLSQSIFKDKMKLSVFNIYHKKNSKERKENDVIILEPNLSGFGRREDITRDVDSEGNTINISLTNKDTEKLDFYYNLTLKDLQLETEQMKKYQFFSTEGRDEQQSRSKSQLFNQVLDISYKLSENHAQGWLVNFNLSKNQNLEDSFADRRLFFHPIFNLQNNENQIQQNQTEINKKLGLNFQHKYNFWGHHQLGVHLDLNHKNQTLDNIFWVNDVQRNELTSEWRYRTNNTNIGMEYLFKNKRLTLSLFGNMVGINTKFLSNTNQVDRYDYFLLPTAKFEYKSTKVGQFNVNYERSVQDISTNYLYTGFYFKSKAYLFTGLEHLGHPLTEKMGFRYTKKSGHYGYDFYFKYQFINRLKGYIADTQTTSIQRTNTAKFSENIGTQNTLDTQLEKQILKKKISLIARSSISSEKYLIKINGEDTEGRASSKVFGLAVKSRFKGNYNFEIYNNYNEIHYLNSLSEVKNRLNELGGSISLNPLEQLSISGDFSFNKDFQSGASYSKSIVKLDYNLNSSVYFNFAMNNIFGANEKILIHSEDYFSYHQKELLMPRFFYIGITYKF